MNANTELYRVKVKSDPSNVFDGVIAPEGEVWTVEQMEAIIDDDIAGITNAIRERPRAIECVGCEMTGAVVTIEMER
jgi:hypothetical protein